MTPEKSSNYVAFIGLDWADRSHQICLRVAEAGNDELSVLVQDSTAIHAWANALRVRFPHGRIALALEQSRGALIYALSSHEHLDLYPINPAMVARYRSAAKTSGSKHDPLDASLICELVRLHCDWLRVLRPMAAPVRELQLLVEARRRCVNQRLALGNQLTALLKSYYPQALELVGTDLGAPLVAAFLARWPTPDALRRARRTTLRNFYYAHGVRSSACIEERLTIAQQIVPLTDDAAVLAVQPMLVHVVLEQLKVLHHAVAQQDKRIRSVFNAHDDAALFSCLPGAGEQLAPRLFVAFGQDRTRFPSVRQLQQYSGIAPVREQSGQSCWTHWRWHCPKFLRQSFHEFAGCSIPQSRWAKAYYQQQRERGKSHHQALRALAFKWQRIIFRCWQSGELYDESRYIDALRKKGSALVSRIDALGTRAA
ncbi:MAG: IS110 family transposase [Gammaproteobacteria bacterium]|nr:MAG: IS110 family transposase [Gammaproteobacteria bacterium]